MKKLLTAALMGLMLTATSAFAGVLVSNSDVIIEAADEYIVAGELVVPAGSSGVIVSVIYAGNSEPVFVHTRNPAGSVQCADIMHIGELTTCNITNSQASLYGTWTVDVLDSAGVTLLSSTPFVVGDGSVLPTTSEESVTEAVTTLDDAIASGTVTVKAGFFEAVLDNALRQVEKGNILVAAKMLEALIAEINDQLNDGTIDPTAAAELLALIENALALL